MGYDMRLLLLRLRKARRVVNAMGLRMQSESTSYGVGDLGPRSLAQGVWEAI